MKNIGTFFVTLIIVSSVIIGYAYAGPDVNSRIEIDGNYSSIPINSQIAQQAQSKTQTGKNITIDSLHIENLSTVFSGTIVGWPESGFLFQFDDYVNVVSYIQAWWSINGLNPDRGWFYGHNSSTEVAFIVGITDVCEITDASIYTYDSYSVGPVYEGDFVLFHNIYTDYYAAFRVDDIYGTQASNSYLDVTWYFQQNGTPNFGPCSSATLIISPPSGDYVTTQHFDLTLIVEAPGLSTVGISGTLDGSDVTGALAGCVIPGTIVSGGQTFKCSGLTGGLFGTGTHVLSVKLELSDGSFLNDTVIWEIIENTEP